MDDAFLVRGFERVGDLTRGDECLLNWHRARRETLDDGLAFDELEHEAADAVGLLQSVDRANVRMVQRRQHPRLAFEARKPIRVRQEVVGHDLDGDIAAQLRVVGTIHVAHSTGAEERENFVRTDLPARQRRAVRISQDTGRHRSYRRREKLVRCVRVRQQRFHLLSQLCVISA